MLAHIHTHTQSTPNRLCWLRWRRRMELAERERCHCAIHAHISLRRMQSPSSSVRGAAQTSSSVRVELMWRRHAATLGVWRHFSTSIFNWIHFAIDSTAHTGLCVCARTVIERNANGTVTESRLQDRCAWPHLCECEETQLMINAAPCGR